MPNRPVSPRLIAALEPYRIALWPMPGPALIREAATQGDRLDVHLVADWCWLGTARDDGELGRLLEAPPRPQFDIDVARMLQRRWAKGTLRLTAVPISEPVAGYYDGLITS